MVHLPGLFEEIETLSGQGVNVDGRLKISDRAHLLFDLHKEIDGLREAELAGKMIGTTKRGIGPAYASKVGFPLCARAIGIGICLCAGRMSACEAGCGPRGNAGRCSQRSHQWRAGQLGHGSNRATQQPRMPTFVCLAGHAQRHQGGRPAGPGGLCRKTAGAPAGRLPLAGGLMLSRFHEMFCR